MSSSTMTASHSTLQMKAGDLRSRAVGFWIFGTFFMILTMVLLGGITRLTGSGLSMVEWKPVAGFLPPMSAAAWEELFLKYQASPQFELINNWMELADFKKIFFWEYIHRVWGRLIGLFVLIPGVWFLIRGRASGLVFKRMTIAFLIGGLQGLLGWYMVKSGLAADPYVSPYRLAAHLVLAFGVAQWIWWTGLQWSTQTTKTSQDNDRLISLQAPKRRAIQLGWLLFFAVSIQIIIGGFMAGTRAGYVFATFPDYHGQWIPSGIWISSFGWIQNWIENPIAVHFVHRSGAYFILLLAVSISFWWRSHYRAAWNLKCFRVWWWIFGLQVALGIGTVILNVPIAWASLHQLVGLLLLTSTTHLVFRIKNNTENQSPHLLR